jgi:asparaginyl-tRNA synthetase
MTDPWYRNLARLQDTLTRSTVRFYGERGISTLHLPLTTGAISSPMGLGSDSMPVKIEIDGAPTYLADSMQFMLEFGCRLLPAGCYYLMPSFRGEATDGTHLAQFYHSEAEIPGGLDDVMRLVEDYVRRLTADIVGECGELLDSSGVDVSRLTRLGERNTFPRLTFDEAVEVLDGEGCLQRDGWRTLSRAAEQELLARMGEPVWVTYWDELAVPFYQATVEVDGRAKAVNADLLLGVGEVVGCGQRHADAATVLAALNRHQVDPHTYAWYVDMKREHPMTTAGFGLGVERYLMWVLDHTDIRDLQLAPRENGKVAYF